MRRRRFLTALAGAAGALALHGAPRAQARALEVEVWKSPSCGCCKDWIAHLEANGFKARVHDTGNTAARARLKVPLALGSCHTALVGGYAIEGHVPAADIHRLLRERPRAIGLAVPGMPLGSPGMDGPAYDNRQEPFDVLLVTAGGGTQVFNSHFRRKERT